MGVQQRDDRDLIAAYLQGEAEAVAAMEVWILRAARSYRRRLDHCWDDVLQDLQLEVYRLLAGGRFRGEAALSTYLWRVVSHTCLDRIRRRSASARPSSTRRCWKVGDAATAISAERRRWSESRDLVQRVLAEVPEECHRLWEMVLAGHSYREMSAALEHRRGHPAGARPALPQEGPRGARPSPRGAAGADMRM